MAILVSVILFLFLMGTITVFGYRRYAKPGRVYDTLGTAAAAAPETALLDAPSPSQGLFVKLTQQIGEKIPASDQDVTAAKRLLVAAGHRSDTAVRIYLGTRVVLAIGLLIVAFLSRNVVTDNPVLRIVFVIGAAVVGYFGPSFVLEHMVTARQERLRLSLPDALDLMVVCVEAGLGLDQAIRAVSEELRITHKDISDELGLVVLEMRAGKRRADALKNLADRTGESELRKLVAILVQADRFGTSIAESLRTHSDFMRVRRRQEAEERAAKVGVKLVFPIFFCILPTLFVVTVGPMAVRIVREMLPMMNNL